METLNGLGIDASMLHADRRFKGCDWFEHEAPISYVATTKFQPGDVLVVPETLNELIAHIAPSVAKVILNQGVYLTFRRSVLPVQDNPPSPYRHPEVLGAITLSADSTSYLKYVFAGINAWQVTPSINPKVFSPLMHVPRQRWVAYSPRDRNLKDVVQVLSILHERGRLGNNGWQAVPLENLSERDMAAALQRCAITLCFSNQEGFGLVPAEAMACGSIVVGFPGGGGKEFLTAPYAYPVADQDVLGLAQTASNLIDNYDTHRDFLTARGLSAAEFIHEKYAPEVHVRQIKAVFDQLGKQARNCGLTGSSINPVVPRLINLEKTALAAQLEALRAGGLPPYGEGLLTADSLRAAPVSRSLECDFSPG